MAFMQPQIQFGDWWEIETESEGMVLLPAEGETEESLRRYYPEAEFTLLEGQYGVRLSAPGYMDCTEWTVHDTEQLAKDALKEMYEDDEEPLFEEDAK